MIDVIGMIFGVVGAFVLLIKKIEENKRELMTYIGYTISNVLFLIYGLMLNSIGLIILNVVYLVISLKGIQINIKGLLKNENIDG